MKAKSPNAAVLNFFPKVEADGFLQELMAYRLLTGYYKGILQAPRGSAYTEFIGGVFASTTAERAASVVPETPGTLPSSQVDNDREVHYVDSDDEGADHYGGSEQDDDQWDSMNTLFGDQQDDQQMSSPVAASGRDDDTRDDVQTMLDAQLTQPCEGVGSIAEALSSESDPEDLPSLETLLTPIRPAVNTQHSQVELPALMPDLAEYARQASPIARNAGNRASFASSEPSVKTNSSPLDMNSGFSSPTKVKSSPATPGTPQASKDITGTKEIVDLTFEGATVTVYSRVSQPKTPARQPKTLARQPEPSTRQIGRNIIARNATSRAAWSETPEQEDDDEDFEIIGTGHRQRKMLTIRSRSLSTVK